MNTLKISFISGDDCNEHTIINTNLVKSLASKSEEEIIEVLKLASYIIDNMPTLYRDEGILSCVQTVIQKENALVAERIDSVNDNLLCLTSGNSSLLGKFNENIIEKYLKNNFPQYEIINVATGGEKCGDIIINTHTNMGKISIESKNYGPERVIPSAEIDKFKRDLMNSGIKFGIFVSTNSRITGKKTIEYEQYEDKIIVYVGPAGHDNFLVNLAIQYLITLSEMDAIHTRRITIEDNKDIREKFEGISRTFEINLTRLNNGLNTINETEKKMQSMFSNLRNSLQMIVSDFTVHLDRLQTDILELKEGTSREYATFGDAIDVIKNGRPDKNSTKQMNLERLVTSLHDSNHKLKIESDDMGFYKDDVYCGKINYKGKSRIDVYFKENSDYTKPYPQKFVSMKNNNYIIELKDNSHTWEFINEKLYTVV
jgi:hypothetical protein|tara:strand:- start:812 stop:2095 length:1284 start_codon:yes stop_codon:yes gene_type:complete